MAQSASDDIVVTAIRSQHRVASPTLVLDGAALDDRAPQAVADLLRSVPGVQLRINSRGEGVVRVRGSEERQTSVFLDGAPLVTPWDGRVDLNLLPAGAIDRVTVVKGAAPLEYGANAVAGVVDLGTITAGDAVAVRAESQAGTGGIGSASLVLTAPIGRNLSIVAGGTISSRDGERIADRSVIPFDLATNGLRSNTDFDGWSSFAALGYNEGENTVRISWLRADVERGIAAQGDLDPAIASPRYWRYPRWSLDQLTLSGHFQVSEHLVLRATGWQQWFGQTIHAFRDSSYTALAAREVGDDSTTGLRGTLTGTWRGMVVRVSGTAQTSTHTQRDAQSLTGLSSGFIDDPTRRFRQILYALGAEVDRGLAESIDATGGIGYEQAATAQLGYNAVRSSSGALSLYGALRYAATDRFRLIASLGRRTRFPSPRELFGEALGRFQINLNLRPEQALLGDLSVHWQLGEGTTSDITIWFSDNSDTIGQRLVNVGGRRRRQRFNMSGSFAYGVEASINARLASNLTFEWSGALQRARASLESDGSRPVLFQRPRYQLTTALDWSPVPPLDLRAELVGGGPARDLADNGDIVRLPRYFLLNLRAFSTIGEIAGIGPISLFAAADNLNDAVILPQSGLPAPGRTLRLGIRIGERR
jgi:iron complex outermembrane receptor protein